MYLQRGRGGYQNLGGKDVLPAGHICMENEIIILWSDCESLSDCFPPAPYALRPCYMSSFD